MEETLKSGALVPDSAILGLIMTELTGRGWMRRPRRLTSSPLAETPARTHYEYSDDPSASFILDGFPRTVEQARQLDAVVPINLAVHIDTPVAAVLERICNRWVHVPSGRVYNTTFHPPRVAGRDDVTGEPLTQRADDCPETWTARLQQFEETSRPLLQHYDRLGVLWTVKGESSDDISPLLFDEFSRRFCRDP